MANLKEEIDLLRETNKVLQNTINQLLQELDAKSAPSTQVIAFLHTKLVTNTRPTSDKWLPRASNLF